MSQEQVSNDRVNWIDLEPGMDRQAFQWYRVTDVASAANAKQHLDEAVSLLGEISDSGLYLGDGETGFAQRIVELLERIDSAP